MIHLHVNAPAIEEAFSGSWESPAPAGAGKSLGNDDCRCWLPATRSASWKLPGRTAVIPTPRPSSSCKISWSPSSFASRILRKRPSWPAWESVAGQEAGTAPPPQSPVETGRKLKGSIQFQDYPQVDHPMTVRLLIAAAVLLGTRSVLPVGWLEYRRSGVRGQS